MFNPLESSWDQSARRGRATVASFTLQSVSLCLLIAASILWVQRPPQVRWLQISPPVAFNQSEEAQRPPLDRKVVASMVHMRPIIALPSVPRETPTISDAESDPLAVDAPSLDVGAGGGPGIGANHGLGDGWPIVIPARPAPLKPLLVSHWAEGNLLHRVPPLYPALARQARIQGPVELRAIISKTGTIENLALVSGHPMLSAAAIAAVKQWRYRPYLLNNEPIEVEAEITVNFVLSGGG
jgi:periplasmic protein TonB